MIPLERRKKLLSFIHQEGIASIATLVELLNVSHMTIRRDIQKLEEEGKVISVSGGVQLFEHLPQEASHDDKSLLFQTQKEEIGIAASKLIKAHSTIYLDAGTTTLEIARHIAERDDLLVITNDFPIANFLMKQGKCELLQIGGSVNKENYSTVGFLASQFLKQLSIDMSFISTSSWSLKGLTTPSENKIPVKNAIIEVSSQNILVSDSSKYGKIASFTLFPLTSFNAIITDKALPDSAKENITNMGIELVLI